MKRTTLSSRWVHVVWLIVSNNLGERTFNFFFFLLCWKDLFSCKLIDHKPVFHFLIKSLMKKRYQFVIKLTFKFCCFQWKYYNCLWSTMCNCPHILDERNIFIHNVTEFCYLSSWKFPALFQSDFHVQFLGIIRLLHLHVKLKSGSLLLSKCPLPSIKLGIQ